MARLSMYCWLTLVAYINCLPIWSKIGISNFAYENFCIHLYNLHAHTNSSINTSKKGYVSTFLLTFRLIYFFISQRTNPKIKTK